MSHAVEVRNLSYSIRGKNILSDISLSVSGGEYVSLIGPNGAGKTTLLQCINRMYDGGTGEIFLNGRSLHEYSRRDIARAVSYVPQNDGRQFPFTVFDFVMMGRYAYMQAFSSPSSDDRDAVHDALSLTGTELFKDRLVPTLSGGERQKVLIAAAVAQATPIMLLDEPTTFLDPKHEADIQDMLIKIHRERNITILSVTHDINSAALVSNRIIALKNGTIAFCGISQELMCDTVLQSIYDYSFLLSEHPRTHIPLIVPEISA